MLASRLLGRVISFASYLSLTLSLCFAILLGGIIGFFRVLPGGDMLAYSSTRSGNSDIYLLDLNTYTEVRLTYNRAIDSSPAWSPDGMQIAFSSFRVDNWEIYAVNLDGRGLQRLTNNSNQDTVPAWSPDGSRVAFLSAGFQYNKRQFVKIDGSGAGEISDDFDLDGWYPAWSPQHQLFVRASSDSIQGDMEIFTFDIDGNNLRQLTDNRHGDFSPSWSPDGSHIVFISTRDGNYNVYIMDADGGNQRRLTQSESNENGPVWRPVQRENLTSSGYS